MIKSMTGYGSAEAVHPSLGKICVELRSSNHKFLEIVLHAPEGMIAIEDRIKKDVEARLKRGRITCVITGSGTASSRVFVNEKLLGNYMAAIRAIRQRYHLSAPVSVETLVTLPGVLNLVEEKLPAMRLWPLLKKALKEALADMVAMRRKEGQALFGYLKTRADELDAGLRAVRQRFKSAIREKLASLSTDLERSAFLKESDITEELDRLSYHVKNFKQKLGVNLPVGKELDFIAQEMQREANTIGAKSCDAEISVQVVQIKSHIEKLREQVQNVE